MRACGRHQCKRRCCDGSACGVCDQPCARRLRCGNHVCPAPCHAGPCQPCPLTATVACACCRTSYAVPCGSEVQLCTAPCVSQVHLCCSNLAIITHDKEEALILAPQSGVHVKWVGGDVRHAWAIRTCMNRWKCIQSSAIIIVVTLQCVTSRRQPLQPCALTVGIRPCPSCGLHSY